MNHSHRGAWAILAIVLVVFVIIALLYAFGGSSQQPSQSQQQASQPATTSGIQAVFTCDDGRSINAVFMNATTSTTTGNYVQLSLSDGRQMTLPQVISADGAKYANSDESFVFWNVGNGATIWENGTTTYSNCSTQTS